MTAYTLNHCTGPADMAAVGSALLARWMQETLQTGQPCTVALSGGATPVATYEQLAQAPGIAWSQVTLCLADERLVGAEVSESNTGLLRRAFANAHDVTYLLPDTSKDPIAVTADYEKKLAGRSIDVAVLGMGDDGHIASLFPPLTDEGLTRMGVVHTTTDRFAVRDRIGMALPLLQSATHRLLLLQGAKKIAVWNTMLAAAHDPKRWPLQRLLDERLTVLLCD